MIQLQVLNKVLSDKSITILDENGIDGNYFPEYLDEYEFISNHYSTYGNIPDVESVLEHFEGFEVLDVREQDLYLVEKIREEHLYNEMVPILNTAAQEMQQDSKKAISNLLPKIQSLLDTSQFVGGVDIAKHAMKRLEWAKKIKEHEGEMLGIPTGFELLDEVLNGLLPGEDLIVIVARPGDGKSWTIDKMLANAWELGHDVLLYSGEMSDHQVGARIDTLLSNISINAITKGIWSDKAFSDYEKHIEYMTEKGTKLNVVTPSMLGGRNMTTALLESMIRKFNPKVIGIDQLSLMDDPETARLPKRDKYANITANLFKLSARYGIPIILNVQANRGSKETQSQEIKLENIADSDGIGQNATRVISMWRDEEDNILRLSIPKNRYGEDNKTIEYVWDVESGFYKLTGYREDDNEGSDDSYSSRSNRTDDNVSKNIRRKASRSSRDMQRSVAREGIEAF